MKKVLLFFAVLALFTMDVSAQKRLKKELKVENSVDMPKTGNKRSSDNRTLIFEKTSSVHRDHWYNIKHYKKDMADYNYYKYEVELYVYDGNGDLYIFGDDGGYYRQIRYSAHNGHQTEKTYYSKSDLRSHENICYISIYGKHDTRFKIKIYKVKIGGNDCIDPSKIDPHAICTSEYRPVCGCDGKTYSNPCVAESKGVTRYTYGECGGNQCNWDFWYDKCKDGNTVSAGSDYYVKVEAKKHQDIEWMELYVNGHKVRKESHYPYEWGKPNTSGDHYLRNLQPGTYKLKCVVKDKCGNYHEKYCTIYVKETYCKNRAWYEYAKHNKHYSEGSDVYVKVKAERHQDIEWMELYVNNHKVRRENYYPYEWGKPNTKGDYQLKNMRRGTYYLKCKYKTKCGKYYEEKSTIYVD